MFSATTLSALIILGGATARSIHFDTVIGNFSDYKGGLYQSAFSNETNKLYVTSAVGRPPINESHLLEVDPATLKVVKQVKPQFANNKTGLYAVYGIALDEKTDRIWTTHTRQNTVGYYNADGLSLGAEFANNLVSGPRDVWVDKDTGLAYVGSSKEDVIEVFSPDQKNSTYKTLNISKLANTNFTGVMSFSIDEEDRVLYTASLKNNLAAAINLKDFSAKTYDLGDVKSPSGVAVDTKRKVVYITNQFSNNTVVLNPSSGKIIKTFDTPDGPLNAKYDPLYDVVYIACRTGHKVSVIDAEDYSVISELNVTTPNHIALGNDGAIFVTDKSKESRLYKFTPNAKNGTSGSSNHTSGGHNSTSGSHNSTSGGSRGGSDGTSSAVHNGAMSSTFPIVAGVVAGAAALLI